MKERPILFSGEMVRAILEGRKTQTRRVLGIQPLDHLTMKVPNEWIVLVSRNPNHGRVIRCKYGVPGDRLWVRETWGAVSPDEEMRILRECKVEYRADLPDGSTDQPGGWPADEARGDDDAPKWKPSIHMPRWASRITLEIVHVHVEKLQEISQYDVYSEGIFPQPSLDGKLGFVVLWNSINAKRGFGWDVNPWVWVITFKVV